MPTYGVRPRRPPVLRYPINTVIIDKITGRLSYKRVLGIWQELRPKVALYMATILGNNSDKPAQIRVTNGLVINIDAHEIRTGWELEAVAPEGIEEKIAGLIRDLNADDVEVREKAHEALVAIGEPARDQLKQAAKDDKAPERASRAKAILSRLGSPRPPIVESFDFNAIR